MKDEPSVGPVERLFPFVLRARILLVGREVLWRSRGKLHFVLVTHDLSEASQREVLSDFTYYPVVRHYTTEDLARHFGIHNAKVIGFRKSGLAQSIYRELKPFLIHQPASATARRPRTHPRGAVRGPAEPKPKTRPPE